MREAIPIQVQLRIWLHPRSFQWREARAFGRAARGNECSSGPFKIELGASWNCTMAARWCEPHREKQTSPVDAQQLQMNS